jgi:hypothetical protein
MFTSDGALVVGDFYLVEWVDATTKGEWQTKDAAQAFIPAYIETVGILYKNEADFITMVQSLGDPRTEAEAVCGVMIIPKRCITRIKILSHSID